MNEVETADDEWRLFAHYGRVMHQVQSFEVTVRGLYQLATPKEERDARPIEDQIEELFRKPLKKISRRLGIDDSLETELAYVIEGRNKLAHEFLFMAAVQINIGQTSFDERIDVLDEAYAHFLSLNGRLTELYRTRQREQGYDPDAEELSAEEMRRILNES